MLPLFKNAGQSYNMPILGRIFLILFALVMLGLGSLAAYAGWALYSASASTSSWHTVSGVVTQSSLGVVATTKGDGYYPNIKFSYSVNGTEYTNGTYYGFGGGESGSQGSAQAIVSQYPVGASITAYYDPSYPAAAQIKIGGNPLDFIFVGVGVLFILTGLRMLYMAVLGNSGPRAPPINPIS
jgi:hypothetical protein